MKKYFLPIIILSAFFILGFKPLYNYPPVDEPKAYSTSQQTAKIDTLIVPKYDSAYESKVITVIQLYWTEDFDFEDARKVLKDEGYSIKGWKTDPPSVEELEEALSVSNQLWIISDMERKLEPGHIELIKEFFDAGHGVYLTGDNADYYADVNYVGNVLVNATLYGEYSGEQKITFPVSVKTDSVKVNNSNRSMNQNNKNNQNRNNQNNQNRNNNNNNRNSNGTYATKTVQQKGKLMEHEITEGLTHLYEGITVSGLSPKSAALNPVVYGSDDEILISTYEDDNKRLILDGGFTRLYNSWDSETSKFIENVTTWLANTPRFEAETIITTTTDSESDYSFQIVSDIEAAPSE